MLPEDIVKRQTLVVRPVVRSWNLPICQEPGIEPLRGQIIKEIQHIHDPICGIPLQDAPLKCLKGEGSVVVAAGYRKPERGRAPESLILSEKRNLKIVRYGIASASTGSGLCIKPPARHVIVKRVSTGGVFRPVWDRLYIPLRK